MTEVFYVVYRPDVPDLAASLGALTLAHQQGLPLSVRIWHNDEGANAALENVYEAVRAQGLPLSIEGRQGNLGFGCGNNAMLERCDTPFVLLMNQDAIPEPGSLQELLRVAQADAETVAAWEMRQIPYEHPKAYDPVSGQVEWVSGAAVLMRTQAFKAVGGFEPRIFMYGEDVELSWRLRCAGWRLRYVPRAAVVHRTYAKAGEVKPTQALEGIYANLALRARYSGHRRIAQGLSMAVAEMLIPQPFRGRRRGIARAIWKFLKNYRYFWNTHQSAPGFEPRFAGWGFELRREGAFYVFKSEAEAEPDKPLVSILIRTHRRAAFLRQALQSVANQTWRPIEAIVVEDGSDEGEAICREFESIVPVTYHRIWPGRGRSVAGNEAMRLASGQWLCFLDDDDLLFADHVEVLLDAARQHAVAGAYGLSWRTHTRILNKDQAEYEEVLAETVPDEPFSRMAMWHHNYIPIQSLVFHRRLYDQFGGFAEDMDQLEDWNLWTRYTLTESFVQVRKLTSKYRVPSEGAVSVERQKKLDDAYQDAVRRQAAMRLDISPADVRQLAEAYAKDNLLIGVGRDQVRRWMRVHPWLQRLFAYRSLVLGWVRRRV